MSLYDYKGNLIGKSVKAVYPTNGVEHFTVKINKSFANNSGTTGVQDSVTEYVDNAVIFLPISYSQDGTPTRLIISTHGSGTVIDDSFAQTTKSWNDFLVKMGYAIMDVNGGVTDGRHFGCQWAVQSLIKAYQYCINKYNLYPEVFVLGASMGGLSSLNLVQSGVIPVKAWAGFCPVVDLYRQAWCNPWYGGESGEIYSTQRKLIAQHYDFEGTEPTWNASQVANESERQYFIDNWNKVSGYNPILNGVVNKDSVLVTDATASADAYNALIKIPTVPCKIWQSDVDTTVSPEYGKYFVQSIKNGGGIAEHRSYPSGGHTPAWGDTVTITNSQGKSVSGYTNEVECYYWFKRWE